MKPPHMALSSPARVAAISLIILHAMTQTSHARDQEHALSSEQRSAFARLALKGLSKEYPNKPEHVMVGPSDVKGPQELHPAFYGSYDWHSSVHGHWMLVRLIRVFPDLKEAAEIRAVLRAHLTPEKLKVEALYFGRKDSKSFERPYGWAWLLKLAEEMHGWNDPDAQIWAANLRPLTDVIVARYLDFFPKQTYPIRTGVHPNTAFGLAFAHDYAVAARNTRLAALVAERARTYFGQDVQAPAAWEPGGADFFSPSLMEADLMRRSATAQRVPDLVYCISTRRGSGRADSFVPASYRDRPERPAARASGWIELEPRVVHAKHRDGSADW